MLMCELLKRIVVKIYWVVYLLIWYVGLFYTRLLSLSL